MIDTWPLTRAIQESLQVPHTHDRPICQVGVKVSSNVNVVIILISMVVQVMRQILLVIMQLIALLSK